MTELLTAAQMRAIERGLPLVRAANTGISAVIDPYGRLVKQLSLGEHGRIDARLPGRIPPTFYVRRGEITLLVLLGLFFCSAIVLDRKRD